MHYRKKCMLWYGYGLNEPQGQKKVEDNLIKIANIVSTCWLNHWMLLLKRSWGHWLFLCICGFGLTKLYSWVTVLVYLMVHGHPLSLLALKNNQSHVWAEAANPDVMWCHIASKSGVLTKPGDVPEMVETQVGGHQVMVVVVKSQGSHQRLERNLFNWQVTCF